MTKQTKLLAGMLLALAILLGAYFALRAWNGGAADREAASKTQILHITDATQISFTNENGTFSFTKNEESWSLDEDAQFPLAQTCPTAIASAVSDLTAVRAFAPQGELSQYGLDAPSMTLTVQNADGTATLFIGGMSGGNYYAMRQGEDDMIYTIASTLPGQLSYSLTELAELPAFSALPESKLSTITLSGRGDPLTLQKETITTEASPDLAASGADSAASGADSAAAVPETSYLWRANGEELPADNAALTGYLNALAGITASGCYAYKPDDAMRTACGFDTPLTLRVVQEDGTETLLIFGLSSEDGWYFMTEDDRCIWQMDAATAEVLTGLTLTQLLAQD